MGEATTKERAYKLFADVVTELKTYPWKDAGTPCWATVIRLVRDTNDDRRYWVCLGWKGATCLNYLLIPDHVPSPIVMNKMDGIWASTVYYDDFNNPSYVLSHHYKELDRWVPSI